MGDYEERIAARQCCVFLTRLASGIGPSAVAVLAFAIDHWDVLVAPVEAHFGEPRVSLRTLFVKRDTKKVEIPGDHTSQVKTTQLNSSIAAEVTNDAYKWQPFGALSHSACSIQTAGWKWPGVPVKHFIVLHCRCWTLTVCKLSKRWIFFPGSA